VLRRIQIASVVALGLWAVPDIAYAEQVGTCGREKPDGGIRTATLKLLPASTQELIFGDSAETEYLVLIFDVDVCFVGPEAAQHIPVDPPPPMCQTKRLANRNCQEPSQN
jgi:hypothetical protein